MSSNSSQADSAGSIPVTRSKHEKRCSTGEFEDSSSPLICIRSMLGPLWATDIHTSTLTLQFQKDAQLVLSCSPAVRFCGSPTSPKSCLRHYFELEVNGPNYVAAKKLDQ
jgi:hypothetical protein